TGNREQGTGNRFWTTLLFVTYVGFFRSPTYFKYREQGTGNREQGTGFGQLYFSLLMLVFSVHLLISSI
ncbi:hypothetical protein PN491_19385, partial [Dolichospermum circinale CS-539/09]|nr:hypothetical protein [Dolichospermum circinale CS-539/09]